MPGTSTKGAAWEGLPSGEDKAPPHDKALPPGDASRTCTDGGDAVALGAQVANRCGVCGGSAGAESAPPLISGSSGLLVGEFDSPPASPACSSIARALSACQPAAGAPAPASAKVSGAAARTTARVCAEMARSCATPGLARAAKAPAAGPGTRCLPLLWGCWLTKQSFRAAPACSVCPQHSSCRPAHKPYTLALDQAEYSRLERPGTESDSAIRQTNPVNTARKPTTQLLQVVL